MKRSDQIELVMTTFAILAVIAFAFTLLCACGDGTEQTSGPPWEGGSGCAPPISPLATDGGCDE